MLQLLLTSAFDQIGLQTLMHMQIKCIQEKVRPLLVQRENPSGEMMEVRGKNTSDLSFQFVDLITSRTSIYEMPTVPQKIRSGDTNDIASVGREFTRKTRQRFGSLQPLPSTMDQQDNKK